MTIPARPSGGQAIIPIMPRTRVATHKAGVAEGAAVGLMPGELAGDESSITNCTVGQVSQVEDRVLM